MSRLDAHFSFEPRILKFGTSGRRGLVRDMPQVEVYINALAEIEYLKSLPLSEGGIVAGDEFYFASDLRPSSTAYMEAFGGNGELAQAICRAIADAGMRPVFLGFIPTPALTLYAIERQKGSIMVTGSHIPFDRNGYKTNTSRGELLKKHEQPIGEYVAAVRERIYGAEYEHALFDASGRFKTGSAKLPEVIAEARTAYMARYVDFFGAGALAGLRLVAYQHSAVGRDLLVDVLQQLGAEVIAAGRSDSFVPIDTENIEDALLADLDAMVRSVATRYGPVDALVSTDGDSDRPLVLGVRADGSAQFFSGDRLGMVVAEYLGVDGVVVPISCNDAIDRSALAAVLEPKTRIGSPFVIAGMEAALAAGKQKVCGWEANGGFLTASTLMRDGRKLAPLPTRDALLPVVASLVAANEKRVPLTDLFHALPARYGRAALLKNFPRAEALRIMEAYTPAVPGVVTLQANTAEPQAFDCQNGRLPIDPAVTAAIGAMLAELAKYFPVSRGFTAIESINYTDGVRISFTNGDVAHLRPSGNADELRVYATADTEARAAAIAAYGIEDPDGLLRSLARG